MLRGIWRLLPTPRGTIELRTKPNDHRVHQRKDGRWCCRVTVTEPGESRGQLRSFLAAALNAAVKQRHLERNPIAGVKLTELSPPKRLTENVTVWG